MRNAQIFCFSLICHDIKTLHTVFSQKTCLCSVPDNNCGEPKIKKNGDFLDFFLSVYYIQHCFIWRPQIPLCRRMLESNQGLLRLRHWQSETLSNLTLFLDFRMTILCCRPSSAPLRRTTRLASRSCWPWPTLTSVRLDVANIYVNRVRDGRHWHQSS